MDNNESSIHTASISITKKEKKKDKSKNSYIKLNAELLEKKGLKNLLALSNPEIKKRFYSGFLKRRKGPASASGS